MRFPLSFTLLSASGVQILSGVSLARGKQIAAHYSGWSLESQSGSDDLRAADMELPVLDAAYVVHYLHAATLRRAA